MIGRVFLLAVLLVSMSWAQPTLLVNQYNWCGLSPTECGSGGYGGSDWAGTTSIINQVFGASHVTVSTNPLTDINYLSGFTSLWVDLRLEGQTLSPAEVTVLQSYIAAGHRVVIVGENFFFQGWDNSILGLYGAAYTGSFGGTRTVSPVIPCDSLTANVTSLSLVSAGISSGGTALFDTNVASLFAPNQNLLIILDSNILDEQDGLAGNRAFETNVANWLAGASYVSSCQVTPPQSVPTLSETRLVLLAMALMGAAAALIGRRRATDAGQTGRG